MGARTGATWQTGLPPTVVLFVVFVLVCLPQLAFAQGSVASTSLRPFVTALIPVVSGGVVGGVSVDADGVVARTDLDTLGRLREVRARALAGISDDLRKVSRLRKVSLRGLAATIDQKRIAGQPVSDELQSLAGLQRVQLVLVYPEQRDIVLAGFAEGWRIDAQGNVVGQTTGHPVLQLDDLLVALRTAKMAATKEGITCSMNPTLEGARRLQKLLGKSGLQPNEATLAHLEESLGPQQITVTGVPPGSHFAHVLVAADFLLKRLGMHLESAPVEGLPSYLEMLQASPSAIPRNAMPRFWLAPRYEPLLRDAEGLAWQLQGSGVQALAEEGFLLGAGGTRHKFAGHDKAAHEKAATLADRWAETMTAKYDELSTALPVFRELRNCMDLAVIAALFVKEDLPAKANCDLSLLLDEKRIQVAQYRVPKAVASQASLIRKGRSWMVAVSGGVEVDSWSVLDQVQLHAELAKEHQQATRPEDTTRWWWD